MKRILLVFGTRPEAIKMCPLANELKTRPGTDVKICLTGQHPQMPEPILKAFSVTADHNLEIFAPNQSLPQMTAAILERLPPVLDAEQPDLVLVHGDTTSAFAAALTCFYRQIPLGHVEAGLRTHNQAAPFPEEFNRQTIDAVSQWHFAPTTHARANLLREDIDPDSIFVTGNTVIDALQTTVRPDYTHPLLDWAGNRRLLLLTAHRRENLGANMESMFRAIRHAADTNPDICILYPVHANPAIQQTAAAILGGHERIRLTEPMNVTDFHNILSRCHLVLTDSGGIQEEATALGKPVLVMRNVTERPEGIDAGPLELAGTNEQTLYRAICRLLTDHEEYTRRTTPSSIYGDGSACRHIADILCG